MLPPLDRKTPRGWYRKSTTSWCPHSRARVTRQALAPSAVTALPTRDSSTRRSASKLDLLRPHHVAEAVLDAADVDAHPALLLARHHQPASRRASASAAA